jgi:hypothetical protein
VINDLDGNGSITDSGAAATLTLELAQYGGSITGPLSLPVREIAREREEFRFYQRFAPVAQGIRATAF